MHRFLATILMAALVVGSAAPSLAGEKDKKKKDAPPPPAASADPQQAARDKIVDAIFYQEAQTVEDLHKSTPIVETYIQNLKHDDELGEVPSSDAYFLGRLSLNEKGIRDTEYDKHKPNLTWRVLDRLNKFWQMNYLPLGFMQLVVLNNNFDRDHYDLNFLRQQFLGEVRTLVFDVIPKEHQKGVHFRGRIWVEDKDYHIIRFNGTYEPRSQTNFFFHFDTWRENVQPGVWMPVYVYTEETDAKYMLLRRLAMKGQTRLWGYDRKHSGRSSEMTAIEIEDDQIADKSDRAANEWNPVQSQHMWQREAEDNVLDRLERAGMIAPEGDVSKVLETVVNNLEITNNLNIDPPVRARVLLTMPLESFTVGHTIVISRGLLDVLPDEASLATILAHELAHIKLGHDIDTRYSFSDRMIFPDENTFRNIDVARHDSEEEEADKKAMEFLQNSPYKDKLANAGLFLKQMQERAPALKYLITPHFGNRMAKKGDVLRMEALMQKSPELKVKDVQQVAALPLGSRIHLDAWNDKVEMKKTKAPILESARDKMPLEITPAFPNLVRFGDAPPAVKSAENAAPKPNQ